jgi:hypothetical protein
MHIENELVEYVTPGDQEYEEIIGEYEEEVLVQEEIPKPLVTDTADTTPTQGKPRCITLILLITVYIFCCAFMLHEMLWKPRAYIYHPMSFTSAGSSRCYV